MALNYRFKVSISHNKIFPHRSHRSQKKMIKRNKRQGKKCWNNFIEFQWILFHLKLKFQVQQQTSFANISPLALHPEFHKLSYFAIHLIFFICAFNKIFSDDSNEQLFKTENLLKRFFPSFTVASLSKVKWVNVSIKHGFIIKFHEKCIDLQCWAFSV